MTRGKRPVLLGARLALRSNATHEERLAHASDALSRDLARRSVVAFVGAGCSAALGYPNWREFVAATLDAALILPGADPTSAARMRRLRQRLGSVERLPGPDLAFLVGQGVRRLRGEPSAYEAFLRQQFGNPGRARQPDADPLAALIRLPISRFITTNYDCEIEHSLVQARRRPCSFTPDSCFHEQLAIFPFARMPHVEDMVFHCHGRFDLPDSIIATEHDYRARYHDNSYGEPERARAGTAVQPSPAYQQTLNLLLGSNSVLIVGYGLGDDDLLRPLRMFEGIDRSARPPRDLFVLLEERSPGADADRHEHLYERYGLIALPFTAHDNLSREERGCALAQRIERIHADLETWREGWRRKPLFRRVEVNSSPPTPYVHHGLDLPEEIGAERVVSRVAEILRMLSLPATRVIGLVGQGGAGKSWHALRLIEALQRHESGWDGVVFWSSYYANDALSAVDRILAYADRDGPPDVARFSRLAQVLAKRRLVIVIDGFERLMRPCGVDPEVGEAQGEPTRRLLSLFLGTEPPCKSKLVITSRLWPAELLEAERNQRAIRQRVGGLRTADLVDVPSFETLSEEDRSALCALLDGHAYALALAAAYLADKHDGSPAERLRNLMSHLANAQPELRLSQMIRLAVKDAGDLAKALLERLSAFMSPIDATVLEVCYASARAAIAADAPAQPLDDVVRELRRSRLIFAIRDDQRRQRPAEYVVHPTVRGSAFDEGKLQRASHPSFSLPGFTTGTAPVHPGSPRSVEVMRDVFARLAARFEQESSGDQPEKATSAARAMFGLVRSRMEANSAARWIRYDEYIWFGMRVINACRRASPGSWSAREVHEAVKVEHPNAPLHADEIGWLYNDLGLALCGEGDMQDTYALWEQGYQMSRLIEGDSPVPQRTVQSQLHLAHTFLDLGQLDVASDWLTRTGATNHLLGDPDYGARILGYRGLVEHLRGNRSEARDCYVRAIRQLHRGSNGRAECFFRMHFAALLLGSANGLQDAEEQVATALALAEAGMMPDLLARAHLTRGSLHRAQGQAKEATRAFSLALLRSREMGNRRLEVDVLSEQSRLALELGDGAVARRRAMASIGMANHLSLGLRVTHSLVILGLATLKTGPRDLAIAYLRHARRLGHSQQYWLRTHEAERWLQELGEALDPL